MFHFSKDTAEAGSGQTRESFISEWIGTKGLGFHVSQVPISWVNGIQKSTSLFETNFLNCLQLHGRLPSCEQHVLSYTVRHDAVIRGMQMYKNQTCLTSGVL